MDDDAPLEPGAGRPIPAGAPIRVIEWLTPPIGVALLAGLVAYASTGGGSRPASGEAIVLALLLVGAAAAVGVFGYRAYRDLTARAVEHHAEAGVLALLIVGLALSSGVFVIVPFGWAGYLAATLRRRPVARARAALPARVWRRTAIIAAAVGLLCVLLLPVGSSLRSSSGSRSGFDGAPRRCDRGSTDDIRALAAQMSSVGRGAPTLLTSASGPL